MTHKKVLTVFFIGLVVFAAMIPGYKVHGQAALFIELAFPQLAFPGDVVNLLLRGAGFESVDELNGVVISGIELLSKPAITAPTKFWRLKSALLSANLVPKRDKLREI